MTTLDERPPTLEPAPPGRRRQRAQRSARVALPPYLRLPRAPQQRSARATGATWVGFALAGLCAWTAFYALVLGTFEQRHDQGVLYSKLREQLAIQTAPLGGRIDPGSPVALLSMPTAGLRDAVVIEGTASGDLMKGPGHRRDTPLPGQAGISVLYGRGTMFGGPFGDIPRAKVGDTISVTTGLGVATFSVIDVRRPGDPFPPAPPADGGRLTLVTADGAGWREGWASDRAIYVDADLKGTAFPTPAGRPFSVPKAENALQGDPGGLYPLVFWLALLGIVAVGIVWMSDRWGRSQLWLVAVPVVLAVLWGTSGSAVRLLPNLL